MIQITDLNQRVPQRGRQMTNTQFNALAELEALQAECDQLRAAIRRLCDIYVVDDYYMGALREERLVKAVERAINAARCFAGDGGMTSLPSDIELPEPAGHYYEWDGPYGKRKFTPAPHNGRECNRAVAYYTEEQVRAAIEADRKRRGEPVATVRHFQYEGIARNGPSQEAVMIDGAPVLPDGTQLYAASQPADPLAWQPISTAPHEVEVLLGWEEWDGAWKTEVSVATWGWRKGTVSRMSQHGQATHWMPLPAPPKPQDQWGV